MRKEYADQEHPRSSLILKRAKIHRAIAESNTCAKCGDPAKTRREGMFLCAVDALIFDQRRRRRALGGR